MTYVSKEVATDDLLTLEEVIQVDDVQGDIILGFNKPKQILVLADFNVDSDSKIEEESKENSIPAIRKWLETKVYDRISSCTDVLKERKRFRMHRKQSNAVFVTISFSYQALKLLTNGTSLETDMKEFFEFSAFVLGANQRAGILGDKSIQDWDFGKDMNPHLLINIASDYPESAQQCMTEMFAESKHLFTNFSEIKADRGKDVLYGHEHFGFKDGLSQPECRGTYENADNDKAFIVKRKLHAYSDSSNDQLRYRNYSAPGFRLLDTGHFLLGYNINKLDKFAADEPHEISTYPKFLKNSSYLVYRKLEQDVAGFWNVCWSEAGKLKNENSDLFVNDSQLRLTGEISAKMVGRWWDGTPITSLPSNGIFVPPNHTKPLSKGAHKTDSSIKQNGFSFGKEEAAWKMPNGYIPHDMSPYPPDNETNVPPHIMCPFSGHIRKVNPRDLATDIGLGKDTLNHRMLRRANNYGPTIDDIFEADDIRRGLLFLSYQTSIENQFEFILQHWANSSSRPVEHPTGPSDDIIIGQPDSDDGNRVFRYQIARNNTVIERTMNNLQRYVISKGTGYFITIPKSAVQLLINGNQIQQKIYTKNYSCGNLKSSKL